MDLLTSALRDALIAIVRLPLDLTIGRDEGFASDETLSVGTDGASRGVDFSRRCGAPRRAASGLPPATPGAARQVLNRASAIRTGWRLTVPIKV